MGPRLIAEKTARARAYLEHPGTLTVGRLNRLEHDLHVDIVLSCQNAPMAETIRRSQLPLIATNISLSEAKGAASRWRALEEHVRVLDALTKGDVPAAAAALEDHLRSSLYAVGPLLDRVDLVWSPPLYMSRIDAKVHAGSE